MWMKEIEKFCKEYNINTSDLSGVLMSPKVIPMIRGMAFEFSAMVSLRDVLSNNTWKVERVSMNAQTGLNDIDVRVTHKKTDRLIRVECKLSSKGSYRSTNKGNTIRVKCMRSRTLGLSMVKSLAPRLGISEESLLIHNDQYLPADFDVVITSIGNAFYATDPKTGRFIWSPTKNGIDFLNKLNTNGEKDLKDFTFNKMYAAKTKDLFISRGNRIVCTRTKCKNKGNCGFIPNYPIIHFNEVTGEPDNGWVEIGKADTLFNSL